MEPEAWEKAQQGHISFLTKLLTLCKNNNMNICRTCDNRYYKAAEHTGCTKNNGGPHTAKYDFTQSENVLECEIPQ